MRPEPPPRERGAALLTVLLLVAVIAVLAGGALERLRLTTRLAGNAAAAAQARAYAQAAEVLAITRVSSVLATSPDKVTLAGGWSGRPFGLPLPGGGTAIARVVDGGNCFNLNGLVTEAGRGVYVSAPAARIQFARLMRLVGVSATAAEGIAASASDWIDSDQVQQPTGAEDGLYLARPDPYRTAATLMADPSELRAVDGMTPDIYARIRPWVCTLPKAAPAVLNVNTLLPEQAPLVAMLFPDTLGVAAAQAILVRRPPQGYASVSALLDGAAASGIVAEAGAQAELGMTTKWFALTIDTALGGVAVQEHALIDASRLPAQLVSRQWGETT